MKNNLKINPEKILEEYITTKLIYNNEDKME